MSDHIEAMRERLADFIGNAAFDLGDGEIEDVWAAGIEAHIAHEPCGGKNERTVTLPSVNLAGEQHQKPMGKEPCPGPHTTIVKGDGVKLYAESTISTFRFIDELRERDAWPSEWRIE